MAPFIVFPPSTSSSILIDQDNRHPSIVKIMLRNTEQLLL